VTSLTVDEFAALVPSFERAFFGYMATWTLHGRRRQARRSPTDKHGPWPTPEDRLLCIRVDLKQNPTQRLHGRVFGMRQSKAAHGFMAYGRSCATRCAPWEMHLVALWRPYVHAWRWKNHPRR
jgi:hypothetical protein